MRARNWRGRRETIRRDWFVTENHLFMARLKKNFRFQSFLGFTTTDIREGGERQSVAVNPKKL
jgi:hypothetical protein